MKVSLSRKNHIIALPQATWKAWRSEDQSAISWRQPLTALPAGAAVLVGRAIVLIAALPVVVGRLSAQGARQMTRATSGVIQVRQAYSASHTSSRKCQ